MLVDEHINAMQLLTPVSRASSLIMRSSLEITTEKQHTQSFYC